VFSLGGLSYILSLFLFTLVPVRLFGRDIDKVSPEVFYQADPHFSAASRDYV
jgi:hypothetical protein